MKGENSQEPRHEFTPDGKNIDLERKSYQEGMIMAPVFGLFSIGSGAAAVWQFLEGNTDTALFFGGASVFSGVVAKGTYDTSMASGERVREHESRKQNDPDYDPHKNEYMEEWRKLQNKYDGDIPRYEWEKLQEQHNLPEDDYRRVKELGEHSEYEATLPSSWIDYELEKEQVDHETRSEHIDRKLSELHNEQGMKYEPETDIE